MSNIQALNNLIKKQFEENNISTEFVEPFQNLTVDKVKVLPCSNRKNLTYLNAFTIDCKSCKDMDDALSIQKTSKGFLIGVHIADVSAFIQPETFLDAIALGRGNSIYLPTVTVPMLPAVFTNNLCSLVEGKERNTISVMMELDKEGNVLNYEITKAKIKSRVKGVYDEVNEILNGTAGEEILTKYNEQKKSIKHLYKMAKILREKRIQKGANVNQEERPRVEIRGDEIALIQRKREYSEILVEEMMILANETVANFMEEHNIPSIYRGQLKAFEKAVYSHISQVHTDLALEKYCHFTSPIRRYADLIVHRMLGYYLEGKDAEELNDIFEKMNPRIICEMINRRERRAANVELTVDKYCYAEYFGKQDTKRYKGTVTIVGKKQIPMVELEDIKIYASLPIGRSYKEGETITFFMNANAEKRSIRAYKIEFLSRGNDVCVK